MMTKIPTEVLFFRRLPPLKKLFPHKQDTEFLFIVDQRVIGINPSLKVWLKDMPFVYKVTAGESLKDLRGLNNHMKNIFSLLGPHAHRGVTLIAVGGGSVGDFSGFVASIFKRGIDFVQIPSSWLAAIDSAHGGKNGLNLPGLKNQVGTFYHASRVIIIEQVLRSQTEEQLFDAKGELYKMALLTRARWGRELLTKTSLNKQQILKFLPFAIKEKYRIVSQDPIETKGLRHSLNLGHTFGHVLELTQKLPHGRAVAIGLKFAINFSCARGYLSKQKMLQIKNSPLYRFLDSIHFDPLSEKAFYQVLSQDKKKDSAQTIQFVFLMDLGKAQCKRVLIAELLQAGKEYGFICDPRSRNRLLSKT
jgi:3-dehydroquinate synthase